MSNAELVKDLHALKRTIDLMYRKETVIECFAVIDRAITALEAREAERDAVLEEAAEAVYDALCAPPKKQYSRPLCQEESVPAPVVARNAVRALKSKPTTEERRTWTRDDGTTIPVRGDVEDRRKSAAGGDWDWPIPGRRNSGEYGRRSGDRARWTAKPAPQAGPTILDELYRGGRVEYGNDAKMYDVYRVAESVSARLVDIERRLSAMGGK